MITENYIKMCEQAEEIQALCSWEFSDRVATKVQLVPNAKYIPFIVGSNIYRVFLNIGYDMDKDVAKDLCIWLPTQEQLQNILLYYYQCNTDIKGLKLGDSINLFMIKRFSDFANKNREIVYDFNFLWLAFVMCEKYNKSWIGEKWIQKNKMVNECDRMGKKIIEDSHKIR